MSVRLGWPGQAGDGAVDWDVIIGNADVDVAPRRPPSPIWKWHVMVDQPPGEYLVEV